MVSDITEVKQTLHEKNNILHVFSDPNPHFYTYTHACMHMVEIPLVHTSIYIICNHFHC